MSKSRYSPMNPEYKERWVKALRGKKYTQTQEHLRDARGMCCLGVLCDLVDPKKWLPSHFSVFSFRGATALPESSVRKETGLTLAKCEKLASLNDSEGYSFRKIADFIEKNF